MEGPEAVSYGAGRGGRPARQAAYDDPFICQYARIDILGRREDGEKMGNYVLAQVLSVPATQFRDCAAACAASESPRFALAELNSLLSGLTAGELREAVAAPPPPGLTPFLANYIAAMVEYACAKRSIPVPAWTRLIPPLAEPVFGSDLRSLRLYLLTNSPPPFRGRNIFIDSTVGDQV